MNATQKKIVSFIEENPNCTLEDMAEFIGLAHRTIERNVKALREADVVDRIGSNKNGS